MLATFLSIYHYYSFLVRNTDFLNILSMNTVGDYNDNIDFIYRLFCFIIGSEFRNISGM